MAFTNLQWLWSKKQKEVPTVQNGAPRIPLSDSELLESDTLKFPLVQRGNMGSSARQVKKRWHSREERKIDKKHDVVLVPSDGVSLSGSESDDSDWSIGWLEPHGSSFQNNDNSDDSFAVLVPCYGRRHGHLDDKSKGNLSNNFGRIPDLYGEESKKHVEQWLSSLQKNG